ncbi:hypothetical protein HY417_01340 [Candidatus Kaiserbacteria bacterium]|nr:hypothetical protein [Candidatus Kaiserbacteria bacterium]
MLNTQETRKRFSAARDLLNDSTTTRAKLVALTTLLSGLHPKTDALLMECNKALSIVGQIEDGDVIRLSAESLPERTEEEKKRKRALLLFIKNWKDLQSEVGRIQAELDGTTTDPSSQASMWGRILAFSKGPLIAVGLVAAALTTLSATSVPIAIKNNGCSTINTSGSLPFSIPGLSLPKEPIVSGGEGIANVPPLTVVIEEKAGVLTFGALGLNMRIELTSAVTDVTFNGISLLGKKTEVALSERESHELTLWCR